LNYKSAVFGVPIILEVRIEAQIPGHLLAVVVREFHAQKELLGFRKKWRW
jgi:hypothetical protein